jgi:RNA polymerase sigma-70 factor (TIGR02943 family)
VNDEAKSAPGHEATDPKEWVDLHGDALFRFALVRLRGRELAEEIVQETFLAAFKSRGRYAGRASERTWLTQILKNKIADHYRRRNREVPASDLTGAEEPNDSLFDGRGRWGLKPDRWDADPGALLRQAEFRDTLEHCLAELSDRQADAFTLRVMERKSTEEVRKVLEVTATNLGVLLHRARASLRRCLEVSWFGKAEK